MSVVKSKPLSPNIKAYNKKYYQTRVKPRQRELRLRYKYGLSLIAYEALLLKQNNQCAICLSEEAILKSPCIDHSHNSNLIRGILCTTCNTMLGFAKDNPDILTRGARYIRHGGFTSE